MISRPRTASTVASRWATTRERHMPSGLDIHRRHDTAISRVGSPPAAAVAFYRDKMPPRLPSFHQRRYSRTATFSIPAQSSLAPACYSAYIFIVMMLLATYRPPHAMPRRMPFSLSCALFIYKYSSPGRHIQHTTKIDNVFHTCFTCRCTIYIRCRHYTISYMYIA